MQFIMGELFCGAGGLALGAKSAKVAVDDGGIMSIVPAWANDLDSWACETYSKNILNGGTEAAAICLPVQELDIEKLAPIDGLAFGFPCNDYSIVGEQKGLKGEFGPLYNYGVKALEHHQPLWFVAENVGGLQSANSGKAFRNILLDLSKAGSGYTLTPHLYRFEEYGVPQSRHRIIIVGLRSDLDLVYKIPAPTHTEKYVTAKEAIECPPISSGAFNHEYTRHSPRVVEMLRHIPQGENAWYSGIPEHLRLNVKKARLSQIYRRLEPDKPAYTVTGSGGGGTHVYHWAEPRALTNRERARLQTFPDDFEFIGPKEQVRKQIGMAVPPLGAKVIFEAVLKTLAGIEYEHIESSWFRRLDLGLMTPSLFADRGGKTE